MTTDIDSVFRDNVVKGDIHSDEHWPDKAEIRALLKGLFGGASNPSVVKKTKAALDLITPASESYGGMVLDDPDPTKNGYYYRSSAAWVKGRGFPDTFAKVVLSGSGTAQAGVVNPAVNPASTEVFFAKVSTPNTGALTLSIAGEAARPVFSLSGNPLAAGEWTGLVLFYRDDDGNYQLLIDAGAAASASQSATDAAAALADMLERYLGPFEDDAAASAGAGTPSQGQMYFNTTDGKFRVWSGSAWQDQSSALGDGEVTTAKLADDAVTHDKLAPDAVTAASITSDSGELDDIRVKLGISGALPPAYVGSFAAPSNNLNAKMTVSNGMLFLCEYAASKVSIFSLRNPEAPAVISTTTVGTNPRDVRVFGQWMFVACHAANTIQIWDINVPASPNLAYTLALSAAATGPKQIEIVGNYLFVACGSGVFQKYQIRRLSNYPVTYDIAVSYIGQVSTGTTPTGLAYNGNGIFAVSGLGSSLYLVGLESLATATLAISGETMPTCVFVAADTLLVAGSTLNKLYVVDTKSFSSPAVVTSISLLGPPEQVLPIGNRAYIPQLTGSGVVSNLNVVDITDLTAPVAMDPVALTISGAGFVAYHDGYVYVSGHTSPYVIDVVRVPEGEAPREFARTAEDATFETVSSKISSFGEAKRNVQVKSSGYTSTANDHVLVMVNANLALHNPANAQFQELVVAALGGSGVTVTNAFTGWAGSLAEHASVTLIAVEVSSTWRWVKIS